MSMGGFGCGMCSKCGGSLFPNEKKVCIGCKTGIGVKAFNRLATAKQVQEFKALREDR